MDKYKNIQLQDGLLEGAEEAYQRIIKHLNDKNETNTTNHILMAMTKNLLERVRTIQVLSKINREESISILTRAFIELYVSLKFILMDNTNKRAKSYYYNSKVQRMEKMILMNESNPNYDLTLNEKELERLRKDVPGANSIEDAIEFYEKKWHKLFAQHIHKKKRKKWYALNGEYNSFKDLMEAVNTDEALYHFFYGLGSIDAHGMGAIGNIQITGSNYKITGSIPTYICYSIIESNLSSALYQLSEYYDLIEDRKQESNFTEMANSSMFI